MPNKLLKLENYFQINLDSGLDSHLYIVKCVNEETFIRITMEETEARAGGDLKWSRETIPKVLRIVGTRLPQRDLISLLLVSPWIHRTLVSCSSLWLVNLRSKTFNQFDGKCFRCFFVIWVLIFQVLDFRETNNAGNRLVAALSLVGFADFDWDMLGL